MKLIVTSGARAESETALSSEVEPMCPAPSSEEILNLVKQAAEEFHAELPYIQSLKGSHKSEHLASWREQLSKTARLAAELIDTLEKKLTECSAPPPRQIQQYRVTPTGALPTSH